jgi:hypothetical protein
MIYLLNYYNDYIILKRKFKIIFLNLIISQIYQKIVEKLL